MLVNLFFAFTLWYDKYDTCIPGEAPERAKPLKGAKLTLLPPRPPPKEGENIPQYLLFLLAGCTFSF